MRCWTAMLLTALTLSILSCAEPASAARPSALMQATGGLADYQLLPRDQNDKAAAHVTGLCSPAAGTIEARLCDRGAPVAGLDWTKAGQAANGRWTADLANLPVGGPYDLEVRLLDAKGAPLAQTAVREIYVDASVSEYIVRLVNATRTHPDVYLGASPRGSIALYRSGQARAALLGRDYVIPDDIKALAGPALAHRLIIKTSSSIREVDSDAVVRELLETVAVDAPARPGGPRRFEAEESRAR